MVGQNLGTGRRGLASLEHLGCPEFHVFLSLLGSPGYAWLEWPILRTELSLSPQLTCQVPHMVDSRCAWDSHVNSVPCCPMPGS